MGHGLGGGLLPLLSGPDRLRHRLQGVQASPQGLKSLCVRQVTQGILRLLCLSLGGLPGLPGLLDLGDGLGGVRLVVAAEVRCQSGVLGLGGLQLRLPPTAALLQGPALRRRPLQLLQLPLRLGQKPGLVVAAAGELAAEPVGGVRIRGVLLAGGDEGGDPPLQGCVLVHGQPGLPDVGAALVYLQGYPQQGLPAAGGGETRHRLRGSGVNAENAPMGALARAVERVMVTSPRQVSASRTPCMALPLQGRYRRLSALALRSRVFRP